MENEYSNRMEVPRKRGRPSNAEIAARQPAEPVQEKEIVVSIVKVAMECPHCRRFMGPRIEDGSGSVRYAVMPCCASRVRITYDPTGKPATIQAI